MDVSLPCGRDTIRLEIPDGGEVYRSSFPEPAAPAAELALQSVRKPLGAPPLGEALGRRRSGEVVVVVSDVTRPVPYRAFLPELLAEIEGADVRREEILILVGTGMHRPSSLMERREMFGERVAAEYRVADHRAEMDSDLARLAGTSASGASVRLNRRFVEAGFRIVTGLVEPHFMAGFSGGPKAVCPGLASLDTIRNFHGERFLSDPRAHNACLEGNPLYEEALSVARLARVDFSLNVVLDPSRRLVRAFAGALEETHQAACDFVRECACREVGREADVVLTSSGGYPLDATFYQCVKGFVSCLPAVKEGGKVVAFGGCSEGVGSPEYKALMEEYSGRWREFLEDIKEPGAFTKDQWEFQMHARALAKVGQGNLHFVTDGLPAGTLGGLSVTGHAAEASRVERVLQKLLGETLVGAKTLAVFPEGPYCVPVR